METYNVIFNDNNNSNDKGFKESFEFCLDYIKQKNGTNDSYFADYKGGIVSIICNETEEIIYETKIE